MLSMTKEEKLKVKKKLVLDRNSSQFVKTNETPVRIFLGTQTILSAGCFSHIYMLKYSYQFNIDITILLQKLIVLKKFQHVDVL